MANPHTSRQYIDEDSVRVMFIANSGTWQIPSRLDVRSSARQSKHEIQIDRVDPAMMESYVKDVNGKGPAMAIVAADSSHSALELARELRKRREFDRTRLYLAGTGMIQGEEWILLDIEDVLDKEALSSESSLSDVVSRGVNAWQALGENPLLPKYYLDAKYNDVFDWFETTRWDWKEIDLTQIDQSLLTEQEIEILKESAVIEFGTLPGAHNFLREWSDEYSFSSWALSWGAEEARHSLVQSRYLRHLGIETLAKHAMYKREPYPIGHNRAATLMMNVISECRAAEYYRTLSSLTKEPVLKKIWRLLGHDESRHARAFVVFCKELCELDKENTVAALEMAYVYLADRSGGVKHPAGFFYPHGTSTKGLRATEHYLQENQGESITDRADRRVLAILRSLTDDDTVRDVGGIRRKLRELM